MVYVGLKKSIPGKKYKEKAYLIRTREFSTVAELERFMTRRTIATERKDLFRVAIGKRAFLFNDCV